MIKLAKTYISAVKYLVKIKFEIHGVVDKPDIIGAIFGQSEGLLGEEMDLKELQKNGKIGRIEINHEHMLGKTVGEILLPSNMDMAETTVLAATIESVEKVGPYESQFQIVSLEDTRTEKRDEIKKRAQELLKKFKQTIEPDTVEITESVREEARTGDLQLIGPDKLAAGPEVQASEEIIVVEGRADVITLLKNHIKNAVAMQGSTIPKTILELCKTKKATVFVDGDRGGEMIARNFLLASRAEFIARAPDGKEVEELTRKEIIQSLRRRVTPQEFTEQTQKGPQQRGMQRFEPRPREGFRQDRRPPFRQRPDNRRPFGQRPRPEFEEQRRFDHPRMEPREEAETFTRKDLEHLPTKTEQDKFVPILKELKGKSTAKLFDHEMKEIDEVQVKNLVGEMSKKKGVNAVVFDGIVTKRLVAAADKNEIKIIVGVRKGELEKSNARVLTFAN